MAMTPLTLMLSVLISLGLSGLAVYVLRRHLSTYAVPSRAHGGDTLSLTFETTTAKAKQGWAAFWARDPFVQAQRERKGMAFGLYDVPGGEPMPTHLATSDTFQHTLVLGSTGSGKSSLLELLARHHIAEQQPFTLIDLHGDLFSRVAVPRESLEEVFRFVRNYQWQHGAFERYRNVAMLAVMALAGCRRGEVLRMEVDDVDCSAGTIRIKRGKGQRGGKPRVVCMPPALIAAMATYLAIRAERKLVTPNVFVATVGDRAIGEVTIRRVCGFISEKTGIHVAAHMLRHTCATLMRQAGIADRLSMDQLGHSRLEVLQRYSHVVPGERQQALAHFDVDITGDRDAQVEDAVVLREGPAPAITDSLTPDRSPRPPYDVVSDRGTERITGR